MSLTATVLSILVLHSGAIGFVPNHTSSLPWILRSDGRLCNILEFDSKKTFVPKLTEELVGGWEEAIAMLSDSDCIVFHTRKCELISKGTVGPASNPNLPLKSLTRSDFSGLPVGRLLQSGILSKGEMVALKPYEYWTLITDGQGKNAVLFDSGKDGVHLIEISFPIKQIGAKRTLRFSSGTAIKDAFRSTGCLISNNRLAFSIVAEFNPKIDTSNCVQLFSPFLAPKSDLRSWTEVVMVADCSTGISQPVAAAHVSQLSSAEYFELEIYRTLWSTERDTVLMLYEGTLVKLKIQGS